MTASPVPRDLTDDEAFETIDEVFDGNTPVAVVVLTPTPDREGIAREEFERLFHLWRAWDNNPRESQPAGLLEDQVSKVAKMLGTTGSRLREWVISNRPELGLPRPVLERETPAERRHRQVERHLEEFRAFRETWRCLWCHGPLGKRAMYCSNACRAASVDAEARKRKGQKSREHRCNQSLFVLEKLGTAHPIVTYGTARERGLPATKDAS